MKGLDVGGRYALDVADALDGKECILELSADGLIVCVDEHLCADLLESENVVDDVCFLDFYSLRNKVCELSADNGEVCLVSLRKEVVNGVDFSHFNPSRSNESTFGAFVGNALVAALVAPSDLDFPALGAFEEGVAVADKPLSTGRANFIVSHSRGDKLEVYIGDC